MAAKKSKSASKKPKRYYPVQLSARLSDNTAAHANIRVIEYDRILSPINRRQYRQSRVPSLKLDVDQGSALAAAGIQVFVLRNTWDMHGAYKFAMEQYYNAMKEELDMASGARGRWLDFRVQANIGADLLVPRAEDQPTSPAGSFSSNRLDDGDFSYSSVYDSTGTQRVFVTSDTASSSEFSIFEEWSRKDKVQENPASASTTMPYRNIQEDTDENNYDLIKEIGDAPPYRATSNTDMWQQVAYIGETGSGVQKLTTGFFDAPLGIVVLVSAGFVASQTNVDHPLTLTCQKGDYKGIKAPAYATPVLTEDMTYEVV